MLALKFITMLPPAGWPARDVGEQAPEQRVHGAGEQLDHAGLLAHLHDAQPQAHHADQAQRDVEAGLGGVEQAVSTLVKMATSPCASLTSATTKPIRMKATQTAAVDDGGHVAHGSADAARDHVRGRAQPAA
jgi:hypothetical protein